jgi:hypothetical protein
MSKRPRREGFWPQAKSEEEPRPVWHVLSESPELVEGGDARNDELAAQRGRANIMLGVPRSMHDAAG